MLKKLIFAAGMGYVARKFMGGRRNGLNDSRTMGGGWGRRGW